MIAGRRCWWPPEPTTRSSPKRSSGLTDHPDTEYHALQTGHFALEDKAAEIAALMRDFLARTPAALAA